MLKYARYQTTLMPKSIMTKVLPLVFVGAFMLAGSGCEPPPRSVQDFVDDPISLQAALVRCARNRAESRYDAECVNARQALAMVEAREDRAAREALEEQSARALEERLRAEEAATEARRRAEEAALRRQEEEYLAQFDELPAPAETQDKEDLDADAPAAAVPATAVGEGALAPGGLDAAPEEDQPAESGASD
jgi:hypothetical protein